MSSFKRREKENLNQLSLLSEAASLLLDPKAISPQLKQLNRSKAVDRLSQLNPWGRSASGRDTVWLFDNTAFKATPDGPWQAEFVAAIFKQYPDRRESEVVDKILDIANLSDTPAERAVIDKRLRPFLTDARPFTKTRIRHGGKSLQLGPAGLNGISEDILEVADNRGHTSVRAQAVAPRGMNGVLEMQTFYAGPEGWAILSDIDDTIKVTLTSDTIGIIRETFIHPPTPVAGMPELYADVQDFLPVDTPWFYLSASPYQLYPFLKGFRDRYFPPGTIIVRDPPWDSITGLIASLAFGTEEYKVDRMDKVNSWLPKRKMIVIGDSTQSDPEAYGRIYREKPGWVKLILIRKVTDIAAVGIEEKNDDKRFEEAFKGIPRHVWHVFEEPRECLRIIKDAVRRG
ncbi:hypothetical protein S7711_02064 [Stachybotrys chartarum IBT 7711]|uniref:Phosphatidate phosphatase APP1 catalytic domain-containing protein n=1 Tax=Stachybotrys chartarum (strain CBS 109288 / IBT 7711) TaxID=1280523 RepID=A0A084AW50_STACB|nr:hypothetical protein S7711_02064 [Stachybotrys chartarum IBT 7711]KFA78925.1 hypothetical protein S40288_00545 [Stachybotrys chartarum IBT 40288]